MTPAVSSDTTTACGSSGEGSVQAAQRGQVKVQVIKRSAPNTETFSSVYPISVGYRSRLARSLGGLGGRSRIEPPDFN